MSLIAKTSGYVKYSINLRLNYMSEEIHIHRYKYSTKYMQKKITQNLLPAKMTRHFDRYDYETLFYKTING